MQNLLKNCQICPKKCGANRLLHPGSCGAGSLPRAAKAFLHPWKEPCIRGARGSGAVFFSGCNLKCVYCQNYKISQAAKNQDPAPFGREISVGRLSEIFLELQNAGAHNINLVSPTPYGLHIIEAVAAARRNGLSVPIIYNTNGYESIDTLRMLKGTVDIYLPDIKYFSGEASMKYSGVGDYFEVAAKALLAMAEQVGHPVFDDDGMMTKGVLIRHLLLPGLLHESRALLKWIKSTMGSDVYISLMGQYTPMYRASDFPELNKKITEKAYGEMIDFFFEIGLENGFVQELDAAAEDYVPDFDLSGI